MPERVTHKPYSHIESEWVAGETAPKDTTEYSNNEAHWMTVEYLDSNPVGIFMCNFARNSRM